MQTLIVLSGQVLVLKCRSPPPFVTPTEQSPPSNRQALCSGSLKLTKNSYLYTVFDPLNEVLVGVQCLQV
jgi:hypothetical protein